MELSFSTAQFLDIFTAYNTAVWPIYPIGYILALGGLITMARQTGRADRYTTFLLAGFWLWTGIVYHMIFFARVNPAARTFGALTVIEGLLLLASGIRNQMEFSYGRTLRHITGYIFISYAMIIYPLFGMALGHTFPEAPIFPVTPCPMTIFTFGIFLLAVRPIRWYLWIIPLLWSLIGSVAAFELGIIQDYGLLAAGPAGTVLIVAANRARPRSG